MRPRRLLAPLLACGCFAPTGSPGSGDTMDCLGWTKTEAMGDVGMIGQTSDLWFNCGGQATPCGAKNHLYCVQTASLL